jgi:hypothetical protein
VVYDGLAIERDGRGRSGFLPTTVVPTTGGAAMRCRSLSLGALVALTAATTWPAAPVDAAPRHARTPEATSQPLEVDQVRSDFDGDGYEDLAVAAPFESSAYSEMHGAVTIVYGSAAKLDPGRSTTFTPEDLGQANQRYESKFFGVAMAPGDFDGDGYDDLAVGAPGQWVGPVQLAGAVHVLDGSANGLTTAGAQTLTQDTPGVGSDLEDSDNWGRHLAVGDMNGDGIDDLAVGDPEEDVGRLDGAGAVHVLFGAPGGLTGTGSRLFTQDNLRVGRAAEDAGRFGNALAVGDFDGRGADDLAIGAPGVRLRGFGAGAVDVVYAAAGGLGAGANQFIHQDTAGVVDIPEAVDVFGSTLAAGDLNGSGIDDLAIGVPGEDVGAATEAGAVNVLYGRAGGLSGASSVLVTQDTPGVGSAAEHADEFGLTLAIADLNGSGRADLAVGSPGEAVGNADQAGAVHVLYGRPGPITGVSSQLFTQDTAGVGSTVEARDHFGAAMSAADFDGTGVADLAIGVPYESVGTVMMAGAAHTVYRTTGRLDPTTSQLLTENVTAGRPDAAVEFEQFGYSLPESRYW